VSQPTLNEDFKDLLEALLEAEAEFLIVGAHAMAVHGVPRATGDIDILVRPSEANAARVIAALERFGAPLEVHGVSQADFTRADLVYQVGLPPRRIDLLTSISGVTFAEAWASRIEVELEQLRLPVIGKEALLRNKRSTGRKKDEVDAELIAEANEGPEP